MIHCNSATNPPWFEDARAHHQDGTQGLPYRLVCELGMGHSDAHGDHLLHLGRDTFDVWVRWQGDTFTYVTVPPCEMVDPTIAPLQQQACSLFAEHPLEHSWEFEDLLHG
ncbi:hypothetical protein AB0L80_14635 [Streptomyces sp. NPDC052069]|uniref:hypothetical protein n=1 Tax=Streptomyces sp. NPDC052069 TaxID=3154650 RepID=UPI00343A8335